MDFIKAQLDRISQQLGGLSASQKMLTGTFVVIMAMTLFYWARYAGEAEMEPVLDQAMSAEEISRIKTFLSGKNITAKVVGDKVLVPVDRKFEVLADLGYAQLLPRDTQNGLDQLMKASNLFAAPTMTEAMLNKAKETMLSQILRRFPQVREANVIIDSKERRAFESSVKGSATVNLITKDGSGGKQLISAAADLVAGSVAGLTRGRVTVIVDGRSFRLPEKEDGGTMLANDILELQRNCEQQYAEKIRGQLAYMRGVVVSVNVAVDPTKKVEEIKKVDPTNKVSDVERTMTSTDETTTGGRAGSEPGAVPNTGGANQSMTLDGAMTAGSTSTTNKEETTMKVDFGVTHTRVDTPSGGLKVLGAAVRLPRSYFVNAMKLAKDSDEGQLMVAVKPHLESIRNEVSKCTGLKSEDISVETYVDELAEASAPATAGVAGGSMTSLLGSHGKEVALGVLALVSLFMVSSMVRKGAPAPAVAVAEAPREVGPLHAGEDVAGEATETSAMLDGMELDDDAIKTQQMLGQVQDLVKENPEAAAGLVKRWLNR